MRREEKEIQDPSRVEKILKQAQICRLAMVDKDVPYVVPLNFGYRDGALYFHSAKKGRKIDLIHHNPNVCFEVDELIRLKKAKQACDWGVDYQSVIGTGRAVFLEDVQEKKKALDVIMAQYSGRPFDYPVKMLEKTAVIKVLISQMTGKQSPAEKV